MRGWGEGEENRVLMPSSLTRITEKKKKRKKKEERE
jgi:hypothetical protein